MKIGIITYDLSTLAGGTQLSLTLGRELQKGGYEVAYFGKSRKKDWNLEEIYEEDGREIIFIFKM